MPKAYSVDLRERVLADYDEGVRPVDLIPKFRVSERWVYKLLKQRRDTGSIEPRQGTPGPKPILAAHHDELRTLVRDHPDSTLEDLRERLSVPVCVTTVWKTLRELQITLKKSPEGGRARTA
jgi:transposase